MSETISPKFATEMSIDVEWLYMKCGKKNKTGLKLCDCCRSWWQWRYAVHARCRYRHTATTPCTRNHPSSSLAQSA